MFSKEVIPRQEINVMMSFMFDGDKVDRLKFKDFTRKPSEWILISALLHVLNAGGLCKIIHGDGASLYAQAISCWWDPLLSYTVRGGISSMKETSQEEFDFFAAQRFDSISENIQFVDKVLIGSLVPSPEFLAKLETTK